ncbi:MAG: MerR family transcriptional regulator [Actinomycetota bacterium]
MENLKLTSFPARRGAYSAERASQLSGVPKSTVYYWARESKLVVPSVSLERLKLWSFQDLVLLRFTAWLRTKGVSVQDARRMADAVRDNPIDLNVKASGGRAFVPTADPLAIVDWLNNQTALAGEVAKMLPEFRLQASEADQLGRRKLWGPNLIRPSAHTRINADVLGGEPFIVGSRIPTIVLFALKERNLTDKRIAELYEVDTKVAAEAVWLEASLRAGKKLPVAA